MVASAQLIFGEQMQNFRRRHFSLRHRLIAFVSMRLFRNVTYTNRSGLAAGMRRRGGLGFLPLRVPETAETKFLASLDLAGKSVYDIGGSEGVLTLFFARKAGAVITYEPNPRNYQYCVDNVKLNGLTNVRIFNRGLSSEPGQLELTYDPLMPGAASGNAEVSHQISATISAARTVLIEAVTLDSEIETLKLPAPDFIKIDIEGMELNAPHGMMRTLSTHSPALLIELHGAELSDKISNARAVIELLVQSGYRIYCLESGKYVTGDTVDSHPPGHLYCTREDASR